MDALLVITKHTETHRSSVHALTSAPREAPDGS